MSTIVCLSAPRWRKLSAVPRILVVDDDPGVRETTARMLRAAGYTVERAENGDEALTRARDNTFDVILSDMRMQGLSGIDVLRQLREQRVDSAFIMMTGFGTVETAVEAMKLGALDFVQKPFFRDELLMRVRSAAERRQLARQVDLLQRQMRPGGRIDALIGDSDAMHRVKNLVRRAAQAPGTVLITGETGTGKELVARAIHAEGARSGRPFVAVNCAALTDTLLEAELFGHARGAFTGAAAPRPGLIEHANSGMLFLDEIGTMPGSMQAKLLRVLDTREVRRIGENETRKIDVRFVAATNTDLDAAVEAGTFRRDLFYRLNVHRIHLPPLRERDGDIAQLLEHFLAKYGPEANICGVSPDARTILLDYACPGNVRELEHVVQRAVAVARPPQIEPGDLPEELTVTGSAPDTTAADGSVATARERAEREMISAALARHPGDLQAAARELQVSRTTLWRLMKKHQVQA